MATKLVQPPVPASHVIPPVYRLTEVMRTHRSVTPTYSRPRQRSIFGEFPSGSKHFYSSIRVAERSTGLVGYDQDVIAKEEQEEEEEDKQEGASDVRTITNVKADLYQAVEGIFIHFQFSIWHPYFSYIRMKIEMGLISTL